MGILKFILALLLFASTCSAQRITSRGSLNNGLLYYYPLVTPSEQGKFAYDFVQGINRRDTMRGDAIQKYGGLMLDGTGDFVSCVHRTSHEIASSFTISLWFYPQTLANANKHLFSKVNSTFTDNVYAVLFDYAANPDAVTFYAGGYTGSNPATGTAMVLPSPNRWYHVVYSYNGATFNCYLDGVLKNSISTTFTLGGSWSYLSLGGNYQFGNQVIGRLKHVAMWNRGLRAEEVKELLIKPDILIHRS